MRAFVLFVFLSLAAFAQTAPFPDTIRDVKEQKASSVKTPPFAEMSIQRAHGVRFADQFPEPSVTNALADAGNRPVTVFIPCGTYYDNVAITRSDVTLMGAGRDCTTIAPLFNDRPAIAIDAINSGTAGINHVNISDLSLHNPRKYDVDGLVIRGRLDIDQPNDRHSIRRVYISGFRNGVSILGRTIWSEFDFVFSEANSVNGWNISSSAVQHDNLFLHVRSAYNHGYGIYWNNKNTSMLSAANSWINPNVEYNGVAEPLKHCAGLYVTGTTSGSISDAYFEGNCTASVDGEGADIRLTGTNVQEFNINNSFFSSPLNIYNDATLTTGNYTGNRFYGIVSLRIATTHHDSLVVIGQNHDPSRHIISPDQEGNSHVQFVNSRVYSADGTPATASHVTIGRGAFGEAGHVTVNLAGPSAFENDKSYACTVQDMTSARPTSYKANSGSTLTLSGQSNDSFVYICVGT